MFVSTEFNPMPGSEPVGKDETDIMSGLFVLSARVAQAGDDEDVCAHQSITNRRGIFKMKNPEKNHVSSG